jgi:hypothetical protein
VERFSGRLLARDARRDSIFVGIVIGGMCTAAESVLLRAGVRNAGSTVESIARALRDKKTIGSESGLVDGRFGKKAWGIRVVSGLLKA